MKTLFIFQLILCISLTLFVGVSQTKAVVIPFPPPPEPIVLVPGMITSLNPSQLFTNKDSDFWIFGPTAHSIYRGLIEQLEDAGYTEGENLFIAHYDWRRSISETAAQYLKPVIDQAKSQTGAGEVDIIGHSMGGLLARSYIQGTAYEEDVNQLIAIGSPHKGAADAYTAWEGGILPTTWSNGIRWYMKSIEVSLKIALDQDLDRPLSFRIFFPSLKDLLPITDFVTRDGNNVPTMNLTEQNNFLQSLQADIDLIEQRGVDVTAIIGTDVSTLGTISLTSERTSEDEALERWRDGHAEPDPPTPNSTAGDQRVLASSAQIGDSIITLSGVEHEELPEAAQEDVLMALGLSIADTHFEYEIPTSLFGIVVLSPIDPSITCASGGTLSKNENTFAEAEYIADPADPDSPKLLVIANPPKEECTVELTGTSSSEYAVITTYADGQKEFSITRQGTTSAGQEESYTITLGEESFVAPPEDLVQTLRELRDEVRSLGKARHIKLIPFVLLNYSATKMHYHGSRYQQLKAAGNTGGAQREYNLLRYHYGKFIQYFTTHTEKGNLDEAAVRTLHGSIQELEDAGLELSTL